MFGARCGYGRGGFLGFDGIGRRRILLMVVPFVLGTKGQKINSSDPFTRRKLGRDDRVRQMKPSDFDR